MFDHLIDRHLSKNRSNSSHTFFSETYHIINNAQHNFHPESMLSMKLGSANGLTTYSVVSEMGK